jgi:elongation factor Tu
MKPSINVGTIGHIGQGKTTLTAAICTVLAKAYGGVARDFASIDDISEERERGLKMAISRVEYGTQTRHYFHTDCSSHLDCIKNLIAGSTTMDASILVIAATDGLMPETREQILLSCQVGISHIIIFLNKCDMIRDEDILDLREMEIRELLSEYGFPYDDILVIRGSALGALNGEKQWEDKIIELAEALDNYIPDPRACRG